MSVDAENSDSKTDAALAECLAELQRRRAAGEAITEEQWISRHPELAAALGQAFDDRRELARFLADDRGAESAIVDELPLELDYIGSYRLKKRLGQGGMGVVFHATQQGLGRDVAVKVLPQHPQRGQETIERFCHEAVLASKLSHPHIVTIFEVGRDKDYHFFSMELMTGGSLHQFLGADSPDPNRIAKWLAQAADAVDYAHHQGIVHRDVKPANLLLDASDRVKVADFGLARDVENDTHMTADGDVLGTVSYMSPEQARGIRDDVGVSSDVYSLGATLYALLAGVPPIRGNRQGSTLVSILTEEPVPLRRHLPWLSRDLATICHKCLEKSPTMRYDSAGALADDLRRWMANEPIAARPPNVLRRTARWCRRNPKKSLLAVASLFAVFVVLFMQHHLRQIVAATNLRLEAQSIIAGREGGWSAAAAKRIRESMAQHNDPRAADEIVATLTGVDVEQAAQTTDFGGAGLSFSADGNHLLLAGESLELINPAKTAKIWDWRRNRVIAKSPFGGIGPVRFTDDGHAIQVVVRNDADGIQILDVDQERVRTQIDWQLHNEQAGVGSRAQFPVALSPDGRHLAACIDEDGNATLAVAEASTGRTLVRIPRAAHLLAFSPKGELLGTGDQDGHVSVWTVPEGKLVREFDVGRRVVQSLAFRADYRQRDRPAGAWHVLLAVGDSSGTISVFDLADGSVRARFSGAHLDVLALDFHPEGTLLAAASRGEVRLCDVPTSRMVLRVTCGNYNTGLSFSPDGRSLAASSLDFFGGQHATVWQLSESRGIAALRGLGAPIAKLRFSRTDSPATPRLVGALSQDWQLGIWEVQSGRLRAVIDTPRGMFPDNAALDFSPDGDRVAFCTGRAAAVWDTRTGEKLNSWQLPEGLADLMSFCGDRRLIVCRAERDGDAAPTAGAWPRVLRVRQLLGSEPLRPVYEDAQFSAPIVDGFASDDGNTILLQTGATQQRPAVLRVLESKGGSWTAEVLNKPFASRRLRFDERGRLLAVQSPDDEMIRALTFPELREIGRFSALPSGLDPSRRWWAARSTAPELTLGLYHWGRSAPLVILGPTDQIAITATPFSSDGQFFAYGRTDGLVMVVDLAELLRQFSEQGVD